MKDGRRQAVVHQHKNNTEMDVTEIILAQS